MRVFDFAISGAGVFGAWIARELRQAGASVILMDAWGPAHSRASSGGESRIIRMGYGSDGIYTRMAMRSLVRWREIAAPLFRRTGVLWMARAGDAYSEATRHTLHAVDAPHEILSAGEIARRYPQMAVPDGITFGIFEPESGAILARRAVAAVVDDFVAAGGVYRQATADGVHAGTHIYACGAWLAKIFPDLLATRIYPTRQEVFFFAPPPGDPRFAPPHMPVWIDFTDPRGPYGFPDLESRGVKFAFDRHGPPFDPDTGDRTVSGASVRAARDFLQQRFPALRDAPLTEARVCQYENTSNGDLLIDRHPERPNVWLAGGGSGHGFKHGPAVAEYLRGVLLNGAPPEPRFSLAAKRHRQQREVH